MKIYSKDIYLRKFKKLKRRAAKLNLKFCIILTTRDYGSEIYIKKKKEVAKKLNIDVQLINDQTGDTNKIITKIKNLNKDKNISGIIVQLPIRKELNEGKILNSISPLKDIDLLSKVRPNHSRIKACVLQSIQWIFKHEHYRIKNKKVLVFGTGKLVGIPIINFLREKKVKFSVAEHADAQLNEKISQANCIIVGTGTKIVLDSKIMKKNVFIIDAGSNKINKKYVGDVDIINENSFEGKITAVPGCIGPLTILALIQNLIVLNKNANN